MSWQSEFAQIHALLIGTAGDEAGGDPPPLICALGTFSTATHRDRDPIVVRKIYDGQTACGLSDGAGLGMPMNTLSQCGDQACEETNKLDAIVIRPGGPEPVL